MYNDIGKSKNCLKSLYFHFSIKIDLKHLKSDFLAVKLNTTILFYKLLNEVSKMSFIKGASNFSVLRTTSKIEVGIANDLVNEAYSEDKPFPDSPVNDLSSGVSLFPPTDRESTPDDFLKESIPFFAVRKRECKIDSSKLKETVLRTVEEKRLSGIQVSKKMIKEIKADVKSLLATEAPVKTTGTRVVLSPTGFCFVEVTSAKKALSFIEDVTSLVPMNVLGNLNYVDFAYIASSMKFDVNSYSPMRFSDHETMSGIGEDFLTYLLVAANSNTLSLPKDVQLSTPGAIEMIDCSTSSAGAKIISMKEGIPCAGREISSCISSGKKVSAIDIAIQFGNAAYTANVDLNFCIKKFLSIKGDEEEEEESFVDRVSSMDAFVVGMAKVFGHFISLVQSDEKAFIKNVREWSDSRQ